MVNRIKIKNCQGVYSGGLETIAVAKIALQQNCYSFLDVGTGNGYIAIFLRRNGKEVEASDISLHTVQCAQKNTQLNNCQLNVFQSDLFERVENKYDCIIFTPPINLNEKEYQRIIKSIIRSFPWLLKLFRPFMHLVTRRGRAKLVDKFISQAKDYLNPNGQILISLLVNDIKHIDKKGVSFRLINRPTELTAIYQVRYIN